MKSRAIRVRRKGKEIPHCPECKVEFNEEIEVELHRGYVYKMLPYSKYCTFHTWRIHFGDDKLFFDYLSNGRFQREFPNHNITYPIWGLAFLLL